MRNILKGNMGIYFAAFDRKHPIVSGMGSVVNVGGNYYSFRKYLLHNNDSNALASDWRQVGADIWRACSSDRRR